MIHLSFKVEPKYVVCYALANCDPKRWLIPGQSWADLKDFQNKAWEKDQDAYQFLRSDIPRLLLGHTSIAEAAKKADQLLQDMIDDPLFKTINEQTLKALDRTKEEWEADFAKSSAIMDELTGLKLEGEFDVQFNHPSQKSGTGGNPICWTYRQDFPHYNTVYLWHEIMHSFIDNSEVGHSVIQFLTDNELRIRFNGGTYPPFEAHHYSVPFMDFLIDDWRKYLAESPKDIMQFLKSAEQKVQSRK